jgi:hypothetical protein
MPSHIGMFERCRSPLVRARRWPLQPDDLDAELNLRTVSARADSIAIIIAALECRRLT